MTTAPIKISATASTTKTSAVLTAIATIKNNCPPKMKKKKTSKRQGHKISVASWHCSSQAIVLVMRGKRVQSSLKNHKRVEEMALQFL